jgi:hypothetical protein
MWKTFSEMEKEKQLENVFTTPSNGVSHADLQLKEGANGHAWNASYFKTKIKRVVKHKHIHSFPV